MRFDNVDGKWIPVNPDVKRIFMCECHCAGLIIEKFNDEPQVYLSKLGSNGGYSFRQKLKIIWQLLTNHYNDWTLDDLIFDKETAVELGKELFRIGSLPEKEEKPTVAQGPDYIGLGEKK